MPKSPAQKGERYLEDGKLSVLAKEILDQTALADIGDPLHDAEKFQFKIIFVNGSLGDEEAAGKCKKIEGAISYLWGIDYLILIQKTLFDAATPLEKTRVLVHELYHILASDKGEPEIRKHWGDYCSIPSHDKFSYEVASAIERKLKNLKAFLQQVELDPIPA